MSPVMKGSVASAGAGVIGGLLLGVSTTDPWTALGFGGLCLATGAFLGFQGGRTERWRRAKLLGWACVAYWLCAFASSIVLMAIVNEDGMSVLELLARALVFSFAGALMYSLVLLPLVLIVALIIERWTRADGAQA